MDITSQIARIYGISPFSVMNEDADHVIMLINYLVEKGEDTDRNGTPVSTVKTGQQQKRSVAGDGFWDF